MLETERKDYSLSILFPKSNLRRNCQEKVQCMPSDHTGGIAVSPKSYSAGAAEVNKKGSLTFLGVFEKSPLTKSGEF